MAGEVIGINTAIYSPSGGSIGIGFSVPSNLARNVVAQLAQFGRTRRGWLGVNIQQVTPEIAESIGLGSARGALVAGIAGGGPAERARMNNGDVVLRFDGQEIREMRTLPRIVSETPIGREVPVVVWRDGREVTLQVTVGELPEDPRIAGTTPPAQPERQVVDLPNFGIRVAQITPELRDRFRIPDNRNGVVVVEVTPNSPAAERGVQPGDLITEVAQQTVGNVAELQERIEGVRRANRSTVLMLFEGQQGPRWVPLPLAGQPGRAPGE
jgi:serine protease Do